MGGGIELIPPPPARLAENTGYIFMQFASHRTHLSCGTMVCLRAAPRRLARLRHLSRCVRGFATRGRCQVTPNSRSFATAPTASRGRQDFACGPSASSASRKHFRMTSSASPRSRPAKRLNIQLSKNKYSDCWPLRAQPFNRGIRSSVHRVI